MAMTLVISVARTRGTMPNFPIPGCHSVPVRNSSSETCGSPKKSQASEPSSKHDPDRDEDGDRPGQKQQTLDQNFSGSRASPEVVSGVGDGRCGFSGHWGQGSMLEARWGRDPGPTVPIYLTCPWLRARHRSPTGDRSAGPGSSPPR